MTHQIRGHVTCKKRYISTLTRPMDPKLSRLVTQDEETYPQSQVTLRYRSHVTRKRYISTFTRPIDPKLSSVVTQDEKTPPTELRNTLIVWSHDKSKIFHLHCHKVQGPQIQQGGSQNKKTPPNMLCDTSITPSRDSYPVGRVLLLYFQLKLSPKNRQTLNSYNSTENVQLV